MSHATSGDGLNRAQRTAVTTLSGPLLVLAGAGTGKTRVITFRIAELIRNGVTPHRILAMTFTNKAAKEMKQRSMALLGKRKKKQKGPEISTFHSLCVRVLRRHAKRLGYPENFTIYDRGDQESVARGALRDIRVGAQKLRPGDLINYISGWKGNSVTPKQAQEIARNEIEILASQAYEKYQASLKVSGAMDFDDLLTLTEKLFDEHPEARFAEASRYDHLLIDEYQDTSGLQYRIVRYLAERHRNICVVGDDDQSIYGWRGAEVEHILSFKDQWPDARVVKLEENYRSTGWVIHLANTLIRHNSVRHDKILKAAREQGETPRFIAFDDENMEAESVVGEIYRKINNTDHGERVAASDLAILFRTNEQPRAFEQELRRAGVPYRMVGGQSFFDRKEIKDLICYLKIVANPSDEVALLRIINTPPRGIGNGSVQTLLDEAVQAGKPLWELLPAASVHPDVTQSAAVAIDGFRATIDEFRARLGEGRLSDLVAELIIKVNYKAELERAYKDPSEQESRWNAVQELVNAVAHYEERDENPSLLGFLEESTLSDREDDKEDDKQEHAVTLMTLHSAKGLEFPEVYLVGMEEGLLPHKRSLMEDLNTIPEERRLAYVGVTRAQTKLTLSFCKTRMKWGKQRPQIPSRFLMEMRGETEKAKAIAAQSEEQFARDKERFDAVEAEKAEKEAKAAAKKKGRKKSLPPVELTSKKAKEAAALAAGSKAEKAPGKAKLAETKGSKAAAKKPAAPSAKANKPAASSALASEAADDSSTPDPGFDTTLPEMRTMVVPRAAIRTKANPSEAKPAVAAANPAEAKRSPAPAPTETAPSPAVAASPAPAPAPPAAAPEPKATVAAATESASPSPAVAASPAPAPTPPVAAPAPTPPVAAPAPVEPAPVAVPVEPAPVAVPVEPAPVAVPVEPAPVVARAPAEPAPAAAPAEPAPVASPAPKATAASQKPAREPAREPQPRAVPARASQHDPTLPRRSLVDLAQPVGPAQPRPPSVASTAPKSVTHLAAPLERPKATPNKPVDKQASARPTPSASSSKHAPQNAESQKRTSRDYKQVSLFGD